MASGSFVLKGNICHSKSPTAFETAARGYVVCVDGVSQGVFASLPEAYRDLPARDCGDCVVVPGFTDLHVHAPQFAFRGLGMDLELLEWLETRTFPEEAAYGDLDYARRAYAAFVEDVRRGPNTRAVVYATRHVPATLLLMDMFEASGLVTMVGKVNMDRNSHAELQEKSAEASVEETVAWLDAISGKYQNTLPILTPRFIPACTDELMRAIVGMQRERDLPVQSHLSENLGEIAWVRDLCPEAETYGEAYHQFGLFGGAVPTIMAHCVWPQPKDIRLMKENGVFVAHCPQSNSNLSSGIAPLRQYLKAGIKVGLGSDVAGGCHTSIFRAMADAIQVSKLRWRLVEEADEPITVNEAFYLGTKGSGSFFGKVGSFEKGYAFDALVVDDRPLAPPEALPIEERLARLIYLSDDRHIKAKFIDGRSISLAGKL